MVIKKGTACAAVFVILLLWGWYADRKIPSHSPILKEDTNGQLRMQQLDAPRYEGFRPREYVRLIRYGDKWVSDPAELHD